VEVHIAGDGANLRAEAGDLVGKHARGGDLDRIVPVVVVVAQSIGKVQNSHFGNIAGVFSNIEMGRFDGALRYGVRHKEEIELAIDHLALFNEALIDVGTLGRVVNEGLVLRILCLLEETLAHALVHNNQSDLRAHSLVRIWVESVHTILLFDDGIKLLELKIDNLLTHGITDTISVNKDVLWHLSSVKFTISRERALEIVRKHSRRNNLLALLWLRRGLCVVLAHVLIVGSTEANGRLLALVTDIDTDKHGAVRDFLTELHAPEITTEFSVHLTDDVKENAVVVLLNSTVSDKLGNDRRVAVNFVLQERVEVLMIRLIGHDDQEDELRVLDLATTALNDRQDLLVVVVLDRLGKALEEDLLVVGRLVRDRANISKFHLNFQALLG